MATLLLRNGYDRRTRKAEPEPYRTMTKAEVLALRPGQRVWFHTNSGDARQCSVNGKVRTWKRDPDRVEVSVKYGLYEHHRMGLEEATSRLLVKESEESE